MGASGLRSHEGKIAHVIAHVVAKRFEFPALVVHRVDLSGRDCATIRVQSAETATKGRRALARPRFTSGQRPNGVQISWRRRSDRQESWSSSVELEGVMSMTSRAMSGVDHDWYRMDSPKNLMVVNGLMWTTESLDRERFRAVLQERLVDRFPKFSQRPAESGIPLRRARWQDHPSFDLDEHLYEAQLSEPGDQQSLEEYVSEQIPVPLDRRRPLWKVHHIDGYLEGSAVLFQIHHSLADGITLARVLLSLTDGDDSFHVEEAFVDEASNGLVGHATQVSRVLVSQGVNVFRDPSLAVTSAATVTRHMQRLVQVLLLPNKRPSAIVGDIGITKQATWSEGLPLPVIKRISRDAEVTVNDVLLTALGGALGSYLREEGTPQEMIRVYLPVNLRPLDEPIPRDLGNSFGMFILPVWTDDMSPYERLARMHEVTEEYKDSPEAAVFYESMMGSGFAPAKFEKLLNALAYRKPVAVVSNVPGPATGVSLAGAPVAGIVPFVPAVGDIGLRVMFFTYNGEARVGVVTDSKLFPDVHRLTALIADAFAELASLQFPVDESLPA